MMLAQRRSLAFAVLGVLSACGGDAGTNDATLDDAISVADMADMTVVLESLGDAEVTLVDGGAVGPTGGDVTLLAAYEATGDFDSDGTPETAVLVVSAPGGTGVFTHLLAVRSGDDGPVQVTEKLLGDRQQFHRFETKADSLLIELTTQAPDDPLCCPTRRAQQIYVIRDGRWQLWRDNTLSAAPPDIQDGVVRRDSAADQAGPVRGGGGR